MRATLLTQFITVAASLLISTSAFAGPWNQEEGEGLFTLSDLYYVTEGYYDSVGKKQQQNTYQKNSVRPYVEYGLTEWLTVGMSTSLEVVHQPMFSGNATNYGVGDTEFFLRTPIAEGDRWVVALQPLIKLPRAWQQESRPPIGQEGMDSELKVLGGYSFSLLGQEHYVDAGLGYRHRGSELLADQWRSEFTLGIRPTEGWLVLAQAFHTEQAESANASLGFIGDDQDYRLSVAQLSAVVDITPSVGVQMGLFQHMDGVNVGAGGGSLIGLWWHF